MKKNRFVRQILIAALIIALFSAGLFTVSLFLFDASVTVMTVKDAGGASLVVYTSEGKSTSANCPVYSLGDQKYLALFDKTCSLTQNGKRNELTFTRNGDKCEISVRGNKETRPVEKAEDDGKAYEFFGGEISFYPVEQGWVSSVFLMNHKGNPPYECVRFGNIEMSAKEYHDAFGDVPGLSWDAESEAYRDEKLGDVYKTRSTHAHEIPILYRTQEKDGYVSFYLTNQQYEALMTEKVFVLPDANGGEMSALFWEKE